jgi:hypothetical protein
MRPDWGGNARPALSAVRSCRHYWVALARDCLTHLAFETHRRWLGSTLSQVTLELGREVLAAHVAHGSSKEDEDIFSIDMRGGNILFAYETHKR